MPGPTLRGPLPGYPPGGSRGKHTHSSSTHSWAGRKYPPPPGAAGWLLSRSKDNQQLTRTHCTLTGTCCRAQVLEEQRSGHPTHHFERGRAALRPLPLPPPLPPPGRRDLRCGDGGGAGGGTNVRLELLLAPSFTALPRWC